MCDIGKIDYLTLVGPLASLRSLVEYWRELPCLHGINVEIGSPTIVDLAHLGDEFGEPTCPAVAVVYHGTHGAHLAHRIQADLLMGAVDAPRVLCTPGVSFRLARAAQTGGMPDVQLDRQSWATPANALCQQLAGTQDQVGGNRVAVLDTGDYNSANPMIHVEVGKVWDGEPAGDDDGHGTAVCDIIRDVKPSADITMIQVVDRNGHMTAPTVLAGLICAFQRTQPFDVVNASLTANLGTGCSTTMGAALDHLVNLANAHRGTPVPTVVAAAGNDPNQSIAYPALMRSALVAVATDRAGQEASYNCQYSSHLGIRTMRAFGGIDTDSFGKIVRAGQPDEEIFGTSFAAPLITAALLP